MSKHVLAICALFAVSTWGVCLAKPALPAAAYGVNLLVNGDAESDAGSKDAANTVKPSAWDTTGDFTVVAYGANGEFPDRSAPGTANGGLNFFAGGNAAVSAASQIVALSHYAADIDGGIVRFTLAAELGGYASLEDAATVTVRFYGTGDAVLEEATIGPITSERRAGATAFFHKQRTGPVPQGTRRAVVTIMLTRVGSGYNHGFADNVEFVLTKG